jgi:phosphoglycolate phosphatase
MDVKAVVFDLDGTLASFNLDYKAVRAEVRGCLLRNGVPASVLSVNESIFEMLKKTEIFLRNSGKPAEAVEQVRNEALAIAEKYELEAAMSTSLLPGVLETLKALKRMGLKIGLYTINSQNSADYILRRFKIAEYFATTVPRNKVNYVKPSPEHLEAVLKALGVSAADAVVVGDSSADMQSAKELKAIAVGLPTGVSTIEQLTREGANYIITSITDLPVLIEKISRAQ